MGNLRDRQLNALGFTGVLSSATVAIAEVIDSKNGFDKAKDIQRGHLCSTIQDYFMIPEFRITF